MSVAPGWRCSSAVQTSRARVSIPPIDGGKRRVTKSGRSVKSAMTRDVTCPRWVAVLVCALMAEALERSFYESEYHFARDVNERAEGRVRRALDLEPISGSTFLDLGSGVGWAANFAAADGAALAVGVDFALRPLKLGNEHIREVARVQADGCRLPLRSSSFDAVLSSGSLEHFPDVNIGLRGSPVSETDRLRSRRRAELRCAHWTARRVASEPQRLAPPVRERRIRCDRDEG